MRHARNETHTLADLCTPHTPHSPTIYTHKITLHTQNKLHTQTKLHTQNELHTQNKVYTPNKLHQRPTHTKSPYTEKITANDLHTQNRFTQEK